MVGALSGATLSWGEGTSWGSQVVLLAWAPYPCRLCSRNTEPGTPSHTSPSPESGVCERAKLRLGHSLDLLGMLSLHVYEADLQAKDCVRSV